MYYGLCKNHYNSVETATRVTDYVHVHDDHDHNDHECRSKPSLQYPNYLYSDDIFNIYKFMDDQARDDNIIVTGYSFFGYSWVVYGSNLCESKRIFSDS